MSSKNHSAVPTKIWIVAPVPPPYGGMSVQAEKLHRNLKKEGFDAELIPTNPPAPPRLRALARVPGARTLIREFQFLQSLKRIVAAPGIVHHLAASHLYFFLHSAPLLLLPSSRSRRLIFNYRGGAAYNFLRRWSWLAVPLMRRADCMVVPSEFLQQIFWRHGLRPALLPNIADTESFPFRLREKLRPRFFVSRNLEPMYDVACVLGAFRIIQQQIPDAKLGIAGSGSEESRLRALTQAWKLRDVEFFGVVTPSRLPSVYEKFDLYLNASRVDNFPGALVEAACSGLPIVTTRAGGIPMMIRHRENGLLVDVGDAEAMAASALELLANEKAGSRMARNARVWAEEFSWSRVFERLSRCYGLPPRDVQPTKLEHAGVPEA